MAALREKIKAEEENIEESINNLSEVLARDKFTIIELTAAAAFIHNIYSGIENIIKQILKDKEIDVGRGHSWHKEILEKAASEKILTETTSKKLAEYLAFRHFFVHGYSFKLQEKPIRELAGEIKSVWHKFKKETDKHLRKMEKSNSKSKLTQKDVDDFANRMKSLAAEKFLKK